MHHYRCYSNDHLPHHCFCGQKIVPKGDISVRKYDGFYHNEVSREEYFLDENDRIIKKIEADEEGISLITEKEYDSLRRLTGEIFRNNAFVFFADDKGTKSYRYYKINYISTGIIYSSSYFNSIFFTACNSERVYRQ